MTDHEIEEVEVVPVRGSYFVVITTALIVVVMAVFTWVMYGMAQKVFLLTDVMVEMNQSFKGIVANMDSMSDDMHVMNTELRTMSDAVVEMNGNIVEMNGNVASMSSNLLVMTDDVGGMTENLAAMTQDMTYISNGVYYIGASMSRMTYDMGKATTAFTSPLSYMFGNGFPF